MDVSLFQCEKGHFRVAYSFPLSNELTTLQSFYLEKGYKAKTRRESRSGVTLLYRESEFLVISSQGYSQAAYTDVR